MAAPAKPAKPETAPRKAYVAVDSLSYRPHPLRYGTEVQDLLAPDVLAACLERGEVTREKLDGTDDR